MVEAGTTEAAVALKLIILTLVGWTEGKEAVEQVKGFVDRASAGVGSKVACAISDDLAGREDPWPLILERHFDVGVGFVILEQNVVARAVLLDQIHLKEQRLKLTLRHDDLKISNVTDQASRLRTQATGCAKV